MTDKPKLPEEVEGCFLQIEHIIEALEVVGDHRADVADTRGALARLREAFQAMHDTAQAAVSESNILDSRNREYERRTADLEGEQQAWTKVLELEKSISEKIRQNMIAKIKRFNQGERGVTYRH